MGERYRLNPVASTTDSGIEVRKWILLLMVYLGKKFINKLSILHYEEGNPVTISEIGVISHELLE